MAQTNPLWVDMTWGAGGGTFDSTLDLCGHMVNYMGLDVLMHITCIYQDLDARMYDKLKLIDRLAG